MTIFLAPTYLRKMKEEEEEEEGKKKKKLEFYLKVFWGNCTENRRMPEN